MRYFSGPARAGCVTTAIGQQPHLRRMTHLELTDEQKEALIRELPHTIDGDRYPPQCPHCDIEGDPWDAAAGARSPGTAAPATALRAADQGPILAATVASGRPAPP
jgi:hypothetical protein